MAVKNFEKVKEDIFRLFAKHTDTYPLHVNVRDARSRRYEVRTLGICAVRLLGDGSVQFIYWKESEPHSIVVVFSTSVTGEQAHKTVKKIDRVLRVVPGATKKTPSKYGGKRGQDERQ